MALLKAELGLFPEIKIGLLYGSAARGRLTRDSDLDMAVAGASRLDSSAYANIKMHLSDVTRRDIDLLDLQAVSGIILREALTTGKIVLMRDRQLYGDIIRRMLFNQADMMPYYHRILRERREAFLR